MLQLENGTLNAINFVLQKFISKMKWVTIWIDKLHTVLLSAGTSRQPHRWPAWPCASCREWTPQVWTATWGNPAAIPHQLPWHSLPTWWSCWHLQHHQVQAVLYHLELWRCRCWSARCYHWCDQHGVSTQVTHIVTQRDRHGKTF